MRLDAIREVFDHAGPFVTVHAEVSRSTADAVAQRESRWTTVRNDLRQAGVAAELVAEIGERLNENTHLPGEVRRTVVAAGGEVVLDEVQRGHSHWPELHDVAPLPQLAPWLAVEDSAYCFLLVNADRVGADLSLHRTLREPPVLEKVVDGEEFGLSKVPEGDWAQKEFQQSAENTWRQNATLVADAVDELVREHRPAAVLLAGETRARAEVQRAFAARGEIPTPHEVESGGRAAGASQAALWAEVRTVWTAWSPSGTPRWPRGWTRPVVAARAVRPASTRWPRRWLSRRWSSSPSTSTRSPSARCRPNGWSGSRCRTRRNSSGSCPPTGPWWLPRH